MNDEIFSRDACPQLESVVSSRKRLTVGVPKPANGADRRFPLTPEGAGMLVERGLEVRIQEGAADSIAYTDSRYARSGVRIVTRAEALECDVVISLAPLSPSDASRLRRGAMLMTLLHPELQDPHTIDTMLRHHVTAVALDLVEDRRGFTPFADILAEIDGRAAVALASSLLADLTLGKGILLGGVTGIVACEVTVIGSGIAARAAARSALGLGATVRMFDNDAYSLRRAVRELGPGVIGSALHPHVLQNALRSADVVVATPVDTRFALSTDLIAMMKSGVVAMDLSLRPGSAFPTLPVVDVADRHALARMMKGPARVCLANPGGAVGRTAAMALSNSLTTMFDRILPCESFDNALRLIPGLRRAVYTYMGRVVNPVIARCAGGRSTDINIYLTLS